MILPRPPDGGKQNNAAVRFRGRHRKTTFGENGKQSATFFKKQFRFTPVISPICGESYFTVKTADFRRVPFAETLDGLRIVCGVSIRKSVNSAGLERDFSRQKQTFYKCDPK